MAVEFVKAGSDEAKEINRILLKEVNKKRYTAKQICKMMQDEGFPKFDQEHHTRLWKELGAKDPTKGFGKVGDYKGCVYRTLLARAAGMSEIAIQPDMSLTCQNRR